MAQSTIEHEHSIAQHPIVGGWRIENIVETGHSVFISYALFHAGRTRRGGARWQSHDWGLAGNGSAHRQRDVLRPISILRARTRSCDAEGRLAAELDETGNAMTAPFTFEARKPDGTIDFAGQFLAHGTRLEVAPMVPLETAPA